MKKFNYWLCLPFLFIIIYSIMVNKMVTFPFMIEGLTSGERTAMLTNALGQQETVSVNDRVAAKSGSKQGIEAEIVSIDEMGNMQVAYNITIPAQQFIVDEYVVAKTGDKAGVKGRVISVDATSKDLSVYYGAGSPIVFKQSELLMYYTPNQVMVVKQATSYTAAIGDKVQARTGNKAGIEGEVTDINSSGNIFVKYNTSVTAQKFVVGEKVAASSGDNTRKVGTVSSVASNGDVTVTYESGDPVTYKQSELQMYYLKSEVQLTQASEDGSYDSTPSTYDSWYDPDNLNVEYHDDVPSSGGVTYYTSSYDSTGRLVYTPVPGTGTVTTPKTGGTSGTTGSGTGAGTGSGTTDSSGNTSSRGADNSIDDSVIQGENSVLADYTSPPDSATSVDVKDTKAPVADSDTLNKIYQLLNSLIERNHCTVSAYGCCKDNITAKKDVPGSNCSETRAVGLSDDVKKYIDTAVSEKTFTFKPENSALLQSTLESPPTNKLSTQASYTNTVFLAPPHGNYMYPGKCPEPAEKSPTYSNVNSDKLPLPLIADFSKFG